MERRYRSPAGVARPRDGIRIHGCGRLKPLLLVLLLAAGILAAGSAGAQPADPPARSGPILYGLDPLLRSTDDPRLLGFDRLIMRQRLLQMGLDPLKTGGRSPQIRDNIKRLWIEGSGVDFERTERVVEYNGPLGVMTVLEYPKFFYLFPSPETLPGGVVYYPPRPVTNPVVKLYVDDLERGASLKRSVDRVAVRNKRLDVAGGGLIAGQDDGLINLTIPIKLPRTLEKIIGRGEKTKIKISGREHISISGESTVINPFTPSERVTSQSLFPTLDMEQELQVNLSGTIGEKIIIEVDHNSAAIGPDGTKIKLMYQGLEDEIIQTIETGDVGLTLPNSQLLGYSSNKSGLFGIKVTGQMGRADFTLVASKQKAESSSKSFNSTGGQVEEHVLISHQYLNNRFFRLDLQPGYGYPENDVPGRAEGLRIDPNSIVVYKAMPSGTFTDQDIRDVAVYQDTTGTFWQNPASPPSDFLTDYYHGFRWRIQPYDLMQDVNGKLIAIDLRQQMLAEDYLAVIYNVIDAQGRIVYKIGDRPGTDDASRVVLPGEDKPYYRMKLLKAPANRKEPFTFFYVLRNIYSLGGANIDMETFDLRIERIDNNLAPDQDENGLKYIRLFGLDRTNAQRTGAADDIVDKEDLTLFDYQKGLLKFPLDFPEPFNAGREPYEFYADTTAFTWDGTYLQENQRGEIYDPAFLPSQYPDYGKFRIIAQHAATSSSFNLGVSDIEEGSETVTVNGVVLTAGTDYEIDYNFGQITLKGEYANLTSDSKVSVTYQHTPFFGGGQTNLMGMNLGYDLGRESALSTTWLYQTKSIVGEKAKLGEEPNKTLVGNLNLSHTFKPYFLTHVANFFSLRNTEKESTLKFTGEVAVSLPNPNTKGQVYLEDFEGVDSSDIITLSRTGWFWSSQPHLGQGYLAGNPDSRQFTPAERVDQVRWFLPENRTERWHLNPDLVNQERGETQQVMDLYLRDDKDGTWDPGDWGGIMRGISRTGNDFSKAQFVEIWVNDAQPDSVLRSGKLHIDFGYINEDGFWPLDGEGNPITGTKEKEDGIVPGTEEDGVWSYDEDIGLDGNENGPQRYSAEREVNGDKPFPFINGTARNSREDTEDLNGNGSITFDDGYFTAVIDLKETDALVDVVYDYLDDGNPENDKYVQELVEKKIAWRKYRIRIGEVDSVSVGTAADIQAITHTRLWFEDAERDPAANAVRLQFSEFKFLGSRWERQGVRRIAGEELLSPGERLPGEEFFLGEVNNKENPDYYPPFIVNEIENIPEKEQSLVVDIKNLEQGHMVRANKQVSARGDNYTGYREMSWFWFNNTVEAADLDLFFRVGSDTLNYYEVRYNYGESDRKTGWQKMTVDIAELSNVKNGEIADDGSTFGRIRDARSGDVYDVRVVGRPDLRNVRSYYLVAANNSLTREVSGQIYLNDIKLEGVKTDMGMAQKAGVRLDMGGVIKAEFDWRRTDPEFHGLNATTGSGIDASDWNLQTSANLNDFIPMFGYRLPVTLGRRSQINRPKYELKSDIEILDEDVRNQLSSLDLSERFSTRLSRAPSQNALSRYVLDPWTMQLSGSQSERTGPEGDSFAKNLVGSVNYDLRIAGRYVFGRYPVFNRIPIVKGLSFLPRKVAFGGNFSSKYGESTVVDALGNVTVRPPTKERPLDLTANVDYAPLSILDMSVRGTSKRDLLRAREKWGVNIGQELRRHYSLRLTFRVPKEKDIPGGKVYAPVRAAVKGLTQLKPSVQFNGSFTDDHNPTIRQPGDPPNTRSISNDGSWEFRASVPVGNIFKSVLPAKKYSTQQRDRLVAEQRRLEQQRQRGRPSPDQPAPGEPDAEQPGQADDSTEGLTPEEIRQREEERLLAEAEERLAQEREQGLGTEEPAVAKPTPLTHLYNNGLNFLRDATPVKITYTRKHRSAYGRISSETNFWYKTGLQPVLDVSDTLFVSSAFNDRRSLNLSGTTKFSRSVSLDVKYSQTLEDREQLSSTAKSYQQTWPDASIAVSGLEKLPLFGYNGPNTGWFRSSTFNFSYKRSKNVNNMTPISYNPTVNVAINPRWILNFHNGMSATLMSSISKDNSTNSGTVSSTNRLRLGLQVRHQFRAQGFLAKLGLYRPGSNPSINMDVDLSYQKNQTDRTNPGGLPSTPTGNVRYSLNPRFSYQISRNLSGAVRFVYSKNKNVATNQTTTTLGMGVEATFVF